MENVPPPPAPSWPAARKRTHGQMSGRDPAASRRTRSPSTHSLADSPSSNASNTNTNTTSSSSGLSSPEHSVPAAPRRLNLESLNLPSVQPVLLRLPSIQELDASRPRSMDVGVEARRPQWRPTQAATRPPPPAPMDYIDLTVDDDDEEEGNEHQPPLRASHTDATRSQPTGHDLLEILHQERTAAATQPLPFGHARRGPRFPAEIIDLSGDTPRGPPPQRQTQARSGHRDLRQSPPTSPEIEFLRARAISPRVRYAGATPPAGRPPNRLNLAGQIAPIEIPDDDEDIQIVRERIRRHEIPPMPPLGGMLRARTALRDFMAGLGAPGFFVGDQGAGRGPNTQDDRWRQVAQRLRERRNAAEARQFNFIAPNMDFGVAAFDLGYADAPATPEREPSVVPILEPAPAGFTRSPGEEDVLICPACDAELSVDGDEEKRQVWLVKKCGHIYCGECAASRNQRVSRKAKVITDQPPPLKKCAVPGCESKTSGKAMLQLFL